mmetsp:Transcript_34829/g.81335  ORF Transcript_34829/g.81335 Transcript_34829/m.81335 type:complete len:234 (-) Transcript_34829:1405-2106(-)
MRPLSSSPAKTTALRLATGSVAKSNLRTSKMADGMSVGQSVSTPLSFCGLKPGDSSTGEPTTDRCKMRTKLAAKPCTNWKATKPSAISGVASTSGLWIQKSSSFPRWPPKICSDARVCSLLHDVSLAVASREGSLCTYRSKHFCGNSEVSGVMSSFTSACASGLRAAAAIALSRKSSSSSSSSSTTATGALEPVPAAWRNDSLFDNANGSKVAEAVPLSEDLRTSAAHLPSAD